MRRVSLDAESFAKRIYEGSYKTVFGYSFDMADVYQATHG